MSAGGVAVDHALVNSPLARASRSLCAGRIGRLFSRRSPGPYGDGQRQNHRCGRRPSSPRAACPLTCRLLVSGLSAFGL